MKKSFYVTYVGFWIFFWFVIIPPIVSIFAILLTDSPTKLEALYANIVPPLAILFLFLYRKPFFSKIELDEQSIKLIYYKNLIKKEFKWEEISLITATSSQGIVFSKDVNLVLGKNINNYINFLAIKKNCTILMEFKQYFPTPVENIHRLKKIYKKFCNTNTTNETNKWGRECLLTHSQKA